MANNEFQNSKFAKFIAGKGFYLLLAICLVGTGTAAWAAVNRTLSGTMDSSSGVVKEEASSEGTSWGFPLLEEAEKSQSGVGLSSESSASSGTQPSSTPEQQASAGVSEPLTSSNAQQTSSPLVFVLPINGEIFASYSGGELVKNVTLNEWRTHNGIDIKATKGTPVMAVADGVVKSVRKDSLWGSVVEIEHQGGLTSIYCGLADNLTVKKGDKVKIKAAIGITDSVPAEISLEPHLHFEMKESGKWVDPLLAMGKVK